MQRIEDFQLSAEVFYRRGIPGAEISLEANTRRVPHDGQFHVLRGDHAVFSGAFEEALSEYHSLCCRYWEGKLETENDADSLAAAWGLLNLDARHSRASEVVQNRGSEGDVIRLEKMRKAQFARRRAAASRSRRTSKGS